MSVHKELNYLWPNLVALFDPKHFLVGKSVRRSIAFVDPKRTVEPEVPFLGFCGLDFGCLVSSNLEYREGQY